MRAWAVGAMLATAFVSQDAWAAPAARLVYSRSVDAGSCPDEDGLRRAVAVRIGYDAFFPWAKRTVLATVSRREGVFVATVDLVDEQGTRHGGHELRGESCNELLDAVALAVAISIDPQLLLGNPRPAEATLPSKEATEPPPAVAPIIEQQTPPASPIVAPLPRPTDPVGPAPSHLTLEASLGAAGWLGITPVASAGTTLGLTLAWHRFSLGAEGFIGTPGTRDAQGGASVSAWPVMGTLVPCVSFGPVFGCALAQIGSLQATANGVDARSSSRVWAAFGGRVGAVARWRERWFARAHLDVLGDVSPSELDYAGRNAWTAYPVEGSVGVDLGLRFP